MLLSEILDAAGRAPDQTGLIYGDRRWTFAELRDRVHSVAAGLSRLAEPGDRVAILSENTPEFVELYYAVPRAGMILVPLNYRLAPAEWAGLLTESGARILVGERMLLDQLGPRAAQLPTLETMVCTDDPGSGHRPYADVRSDPHGFEPRPAAPHDTAWLLFTSGTTGRPKGAMLSHANLLTAVEATAIARPIQPGDVYLFPFPLCHVAGYNVLLFHQHARPVVLMRRFDTDEIFDLIPRHGATTMSLAPTMISTLLDHPRLDDADLSTLRSIGYGASAIPGEVVRRGLKDLGCDFAQGFGMTELGGNAVFLSGDDHRRAAEHDEHLLASCGRPGALVSVRVVDDEMRDVPVGDVGEIVLRGDQVTRSYWQDPAATAEAWRGGWFHTGDMGRFDDEGYLYVVDRQKDIIVTGGENVASREVEDVLHRHPGVREAAVIGVPDDHWGEAVTAVVVTREGAEVSPDEVVALCREHLAGFKKPRHVVFVDELPTNATGKVLKAELRETVSRTLRRDSVD